MISKLPIIGVMGSHEEPWEDFAHPVGAMIARRGYHLMTGAGDGVMTAVSESFTAVKNRKGQCIGLYPLPEESYTGSSPSLHEFPNAFIEIPILCPLDQKEMRDQMPYSRNLVNIMTCDAFVILPGAHGTRNEVSFILRYSKPLVLFGPDDAFTKFPQEPLHTDKIEHVEQFLNDVFQAGE